MDTERERKRSEAENGGQTGRGRIGVLHIPNESGESSKPSRDVDPSGAGLAPERSESVGRTGTSPERGTSGVGGPPKKDIQHDKDETERRSCLRVKQKPHKAHRNSSGVDIFIR